MASIEAYIPFCIQHEARVTAKRATETNAQYFERARPYGYTYDTGGATLTGLTLATYRRYKPAAGVLQLKNISYADWLHCLKTMYWDKLKADKIQNNAIAGALMDFYWNSGQTAVKKVQKALHVTADGIIGAKTLAALNSSDAHKTWSVIQTARYDYLHALANSNPTKYGKYLKGWLNRLNDLKFYD